jgi:hypothetical protein
MFQPFPSRLGCAPKSKARSTKKNKARVRRAQLHLETLENRIVPSNVPVGLFSNEPTLTVNPFNGSNVVVANYNQGVESLKISNDSGATFPITVHAVGSFFEGDDSLAFDAQGRLFWDYIDNGSVRVQQVDSTTGALVGSAVTVSSVGNLDKPWIAADHNPSSPYANNLYVAWTVFTGFSTSPVRFARSTNNGATWTTLPADISGPTEGFTWPPEVNVASNGDVWVAWHTNTIGDGTNGGVVMRQSTDGGATFGPEIIPFPGGTADTQLNSGSAEYSPPVPPRIYKFKGWLQGSVQPRILPDPARPGNIYVVSVNNPNHSYATDGSPTGDPSDIVIARSTDNGATWTQSTIGTPNDGILEIMPAAAIDQNGNIAVTWYQDLRPLTNPQGDWMLGLFATGSTDGGVSFSPAFQLTDTTNAFDPDLNAPDRFGNQTLRIGEYNGVALVNGTAYAVWTGNEPTGQRRQATYFDKFTVQPPAGPAVVFQTPAQAVGHINTLRVTFDEVIDVNSFTPAQIPSFTDPAGNPITVNSVTSVAGSGDTQFDISFPDQTLLGNYTMVIGPHIMDTLGNEMDQDGDGAPVGQTPSDQYVAQFSVHALRVLASAPSGITQGVVDHVRVTFNEAVDPTTFTTGSIVSFNGPSGAITPTGVSATDATNTVFDVSFAPQNAPGNYTMVLSETIQDTFGNQMDQNDNFIPGENPGDRYTAQFTIILELLQNGGFETGTFSGWTQSGNTGATGVGTGTVHNGTYAAFLGPVGSEGFLAQTFPTTAGASYTLDYWLQHDGGSPSSFHAMINGVDIPASVLNNPPAFGYTEYTFTFTATGSTTELKFGFREDPTYFHLDDVSVQPTPAPVPPGGGGGSGLAFVTPSSLGDTGVAQRPTRFSTVGAGAAVPGALTTDLFGGFATLLHSSSAKGETFGTVPELPQTRIVDWLFASHQEIAGAAGFAPRPLAPADAPDWMDPFAEPTGTDGWPL